jgi:chorismate dehydratase
MPIRIGAVSYLNTKPLIHGLSHRLPDCQLSLDLPSRLADHLVAGDLDIALIPSVEYLRNRPQLSIVSDACIACRGAVRSVQLLFQKPPEEVRTLALDEGSRTSAALAQILLAEQYQVRPACTPLPIDQDFTQCEADAILVIGDRAMKIDSARFVQAWDLGAHWNRWAGRPFVFAMWVARTSFLQRPEMVSAIEALQQSRDFGLGQLPAIAQQFAPHYGLSSHDCLTYFRDQLHFVLGAEEREGLELYQRYAQKLGLLHPEIPDDVRANRQPAASVSLQ